MIPETDMVEFFPIRWAFHCWLTSPENRWSFKVWRSNRLKDAHEGYHVVTEFHNALNDYSFRQNVAGFLCCNDADTFAGFVSFYGKLLSQYEELLKEINLENTCF